MRAVLFGSLSTLFDTAEMQRTAHNLAFKEAGVPCHWTADDYRLLLTLKDSAQRIRRVARAERLKVDVPALVARQSALYHRALQAAGMRGQTEALYMQARGAGVTCALVNGADVTPVEAFLQSDRALAQIQRDTPADYAQALAGLGVDAAEAVAVVDTAQDAAAAQGAGLKALAYPLGDTPQDAFKGAAPMAQWRQQLERHLVLA